MKPEGDTDLSLPASDTTGGLPSSPYGTPRTARRVLLAVLGIAGVYWLWVGNFHRSIATDPAISILVAEGILEHGYPLLPSGYIYPRAVLPHALVAGSMALFGVNDLSIMLPALLMSLGSLVLTYLLAEDALKAPRLGIAAVVVLIALEQQSYYATSPRMYMGLQFFTLLAVYAGWKGHVEDKRLFRWIALLAVVAAMLSHQQGGLVALMIPLAVLSAKGLSHGLKDVGRELPRVTGFGILLLLWYRFVIQTGIPGTAPLIALRGGTTARTAGLSLDPWQWISHANWLEHTVPLGLLLLPAVLLLVYRAVAERTRHTSRGLLYLAAVFGLWACGVLGYIQISGERFWVGIVPVYVLILLAGAQLLISRPFSPAWALASSSFSARVVRVVVAVWGAIVVSTASWYYGPTGYLRVMDIGYGVPCSRAVSECWFEHEAGYREMGDLLAPDDVVIATNPMVANYYLPRVDGWLVQSRNADSFGAFQSPTDEYLGIPLIDTEDELFALSESPRRTWVILYAGPQRDLSDERVALLEDSYHMFRQSRGLTVYVSSMEGGVLNEQSGGTGPHRP